MIVWITGLKKLPASVRKQVAEYLTFVVGYPQVAGQDSPALYLSESKLRHCWVSWLFCADAPSGFPYGAECAKHVLNSPAIHSVLNQAEGESGIYRLDHNTILPLL
jgi:hypothetical protein